jgi:hypothetical protein
MYHKRSNAAKDAPMSTTYTVHQSAFHGGRHISTRRSLTAACSAAVRASGACLARRMGYRTEPATCCCGWCEIRSSDPGTVVQLQRDYDGSYVAVELDTCVDGGAQS